jgi:hypothetical protein
MLAVSADAIGEADEAQRGHAFLADSSAEAARALEAT